MAMTRRNKQMDDQTLSALISNRIENAIGGSDSTLSTQRGDAMDYYLGEPLGNEVEGRSQVVSTDVADTVEAAMPELVRMFESGGKAIEFEPHGEEDVITAELATEYCNFIYRRDNNSFINTSTFIKDGLLQKMGILKVFWEEVDEYRTEFLQGVTEDDLTLILEENEDIEIAEQELIELDDTMAPEGEAMAMMGGMMGGLGMSEMYNVKLRIKTTSGKVRIEPVPPEEFIIDRNGRYIDLKLTGANYVGQRVPKSISELREMGVAEDILESLQENTEDVAFADEAESRRKNDEAYWQLNDGTEDPAAREVYVYELYIHVDYDGDGITELRKITTAGDAHTIIENEEVDFIPFAVYSPVLMPHRIVGRSVAELVMDLQEIKTAMLRQYLDNIFSSLNQSTAIDENVVNLEDLLESRPDRLVRVDGMPANAIMPMTVPWMGGAILEGMQYMDQIRKDRTGISDTTAGMDANTIANANTGVVATLVEKSQATLELIARNIAEVGMKQVFKIILHIVSNYQDKSRMIRLNQKWVEVDPRNWPSAFDVVAKVGLGTGNKDREMMYLDKIIAAQREALGADLTSPDLIYNAIADSVEAMGLTPSKYFKMPEPIDPNAPQDPPPKTDAQILAEAEEAKQVMRAEQDYQEMVHKSIIDLQKLALEHQVPLEALPAYQLLMREMAEHERQKAMKLQAELMEMAGGQQPPGDPMAMQPPPDMAAPMPEQPIPPTGAM